MGEQPPIACMVSVVGAENRGDAVFTGGHPKGVLGKVLSALVMVVNIAPRLAIDEGEFVGSQADNGAVALVQLVSALG